jgi:hypothetical protein
MSRKTVVAARAAALALFLRIEEPRIIRIFHFLIYISLTLGGLGFLYSHTTAVDGVLGPVLSTMLGSAVLTGGLIGSVSIIPGTWWAERLAIILLVSGLLMYAVSLMALSISYLGVAITSSLILSLSLRWIEVRRYQHAPGK